jgi:hypothetical protein
MRFGGSPMTLYLTISARMQGLRWTTPGRPPMLFKQAVGPPGLTNFERKKECRTLDVH